MAFFSFTLNVGFEIYSLRNCKDYVLLFDWRDCGVTHDIVLDLLSTAFNLGFFPTLMPFRQIFGQGVMQGRILPVDEALLSSWIFRPWPTGRKFKLLRTNLLLRALAMGFATCFYTMASVGVCHGGCKTAIALLGD